MPNSLKKKGVASSLWKKRINVLKMPNYNHGLAHRCYNVSKTSFHPLCKVNTYKNYIFKIAYLKLASFNSSPPNERASKLRTSLKKRPHNH